MIERERHDERVFGFFDRVLINLPNAHETAQQLQMAVWNSFGKAGGSTSIEDVGDMGFWIYVRFGRCGRRLSDQLPEKEDVVFVAHGTVHELIEDLTEDSLPHGEQIGDLRYDNFLNATFSQ